VEWSSSVGHTGSVRCAPVGLDFVWGAAFDIPAEELTVGDEIQWRIIAADISATGNPTQMPEGAEWFTFTLTDAPPLSYSWDFEENDGGFHVYGDWEWGAPEFGPATAHSGENLWGTDLDGHYMPNSRSQLTLPEIDFGGYGPLLFTWWQWYDYQLVGNEAMDGGFLRFRHQGEEYDLEPVGGYPYVITAVSNPYQGAHAFSGSRRYWHPATVDLRPLFGMNDVGIVFFSTSDLGGQMMGWYLDDMAIVATVNFYPPEPFLLVSPPNGTELLNLHGQFTWRSAHDPDPYTPPPTYELFFTLAGDTAYVFTDTDTTVFVEIEELELQSAVTTELTWGVYAISQGDRVRSAATRTVIVPPFNAQLVLPLQRRYFEMVSTYLMPPSLNAIDVFGDIYELEIVYQANGGIFIPPALNTIGDISVNQGYSIFCSRASSLTISGEILDPATIYSITAGPWNWIGYPFDFAVPATVALASIVDELEIVISDDGRYWIPRLVNTLGNLRGGEGYMVITNEDVTFQYARNLLFATEPAPPSPTVDSQAVEGAPPATGLPYAVVVHLSDHLKACHPVVLELYDGSLVVGKAVVSSDATDLIPMVAWKRSEEHGLAGFREGNALVLRVTTKDGKELPVRIQSSYGVSGYAYGVGAYAELTLELDTSVIPLEFAVQPGYPNPFNPTITIPFALPEAGNAEIKFFNVLGQEVMSIRNYFEAGYHHFAFDASQRGNSLVSGIYFLQVRYSNQVRNQKILLLK